MIILSSNYNWIYLSNLGRAHHPIEYTWPGRSVAIICHAFVMPLFKAEYDMRLLFYFVSLDRKNCLVDRCTKWYNIWSFLFVWSHWVVIPFICLKCCLSTWVSAQSEWLLGTGPIIRGISPWEEGEEWGQPELPPCHGSISEARSMKPKRIFKNVIGSLI